MRNKDKYSLEDNIVDKKGNYLVEANKLNFIIILPVKVLNKIN